MMKIRTPRATLGALVALLAVSGCDMADRLANVGSEPELSVITNPGAGPNGIDPVSLPMPRPQTVERHPNSLWRPGSRAFFKDQRASQVGDILTVVIDIDDNATISNTTQRTRDNSEDASAGNFLGFESQARSTVTRPSTCASPAWSPRCCPTATTSSQAAKRCASTSRCASFWSPASSAPKT
jgi:flagellar L-ring protein precursor FlgH